MKHVPIGSLPDCVPICKPTMYIAKTNSSDPKGWWFGPWNSELPVAVGYANTGLDEPHVHHETFEIYLVARGTSSIRVEGKTVALAAGSVIVLEPGEAHTFLESSPDYMHFVIHAASATGAELQPEKTPVSRQRLGLDSR